MNNSTHYSSNEFDSGKPGNDGAEKGDAVGGSRIYTVTRCVRFTPAQWELILQKLDGRNWSSVVRAVLLGTELPPATKVVRRKATDGEARIALLLENIGANLNQLARAANTAVLKSERIEALAKLIELQRLLEEVRHACEGNGQG